MFSKFCLILLLCSSVAWGSYEAADQYYGKGSISLSNSRKTIIQLINDGFYFSTLPWMKDYIVKNERALDSDMEEALDKMLYHTGVKPFESLPLNILKRSRSGNIRYILAKRLMKDGQFQDALNQLNDFSVDHPAHPFVAHLQATIFSVINNQPEAETQFKNCIQSSVSRMGRETSRIMKNQLITNHDTCLAGLARSHFASKNFQKAELGYLDILKDSFIWPQIIFEEAWTSYYMKNYNRTLGKLVSYKAPVFDFIFNPEIEVLRALTYMKMCLYNDAKKTVNEFYNNHLNSSRNLRSFLLTNGKNYKFFYNLMVDHEDKKTSSHTMVDHILRSISKDAAYIEMKSGLFSAISEYNNLRKLHSSSMNSNLIKNVKVVTDEYRHLIGVYVRSGLVAKYAELYSAFQDMSYINLEVLAQRKEHLYQTDVEAGKKRGDIKYIERNDKQYFWTFNGEFWADELGDYVFALRSEC
jgi:hypothetical protein